MGRWVSFLYSSLLFRLLCFSLIHMADPSSSPPPALMHTVEISPLPTHTHTHTSIPHPLSRTPLRFDYSRPPSRTNIILQLCLSSQMLFKLIGGKNLRSWQYLLTNNWSEKPAAAWRDEETQHMTRCIYIQIFIEQSQVQMHFQTQKPTQNVLDVRKESPMYNTSKSTHTYTHTYTLTFPHNKVIKCVPMIEQNPREAPRRAVPAVEMSNGSVTSSFQNISGWTILPAAPWTFKAAFWGTTALLCRSVNEAAAPPCYVIWWILSPFTSYVRLVRL